MKPYIALTDSEFERLFEEGKINPELFNHEAHLRLAWIHVTKYGLTKAIEHVTVQLTEYVTALGAKDKYNETLTVAAVKAVGHFAGRFRADSFNEFISEFPRLKYNFKEVLSAHYSLDIFSSEAAKENYLEPDLLPFT